MTSAERQRWRDERDRVLADPWFADWFLASLQIVADALPLLDGVRMLCGAGCYQRATVTTIN